MKKTIMIVDDSASLRRMVGIALGGAGYEVIEAGDGREALGLLDGRKLHLIISDVNMPNLDGITLVKEIKRRTDYRFTPVIMLTTESQEHRVREGRAAGARAWMVKPFQADQLREAVSTLVLP